jgi:hypothetical protein
LAEIGVAIFRSLPYNDENKGGIHMKYDVFYTLRKQSPWLTISGALMGVAFLIQAVYYFVFRSVLEVPLPELLIYMAIPMFVEFFWCLMLHVFPQRTATNLGITACLVFLVLMGHSLLYGDLARTVLAVIVYLAVVQLVVLVLSGRFPYKLIGFAAMLAVLGLRVLIFSYPVYIQAKNWIGLLTREVPGLCMLAAICCIFGAIEPHKKEEI